MPNYCSGNLSIKCTESVFEQIVKYVKSEKSIFDFKKIIPAPDCENITCDWSWENWGTKWNAVDADVYGCSFSFETAWTSCSPVIAALARKFPEASMRYTYNESGCGFCGVEEYQNGKMVYCLEGNYSEYYLEDETEEPEYLIPENVLGHNENDTQTERFLPQMHAENKTAGKLYLHEKCDDLWGYEIIANVAYVGEQPSCWF